MSIAGLAQIEGLTSRFRSSRTARRMLSLREAGSRGGDPASRTIGGGAGDQERIAAARAGDHTAFDLLCQTYREDVFRLCSRFVNDPEDAQDIVQEVFARAWQHLAAYRGEASFRTWLWEIGRNLCLNHLRARKSQLSQRTFRIEAISESQGQTFDVPDARPTPEEEVLDAAQRTQVREEIARRAAEKRWEATDWELFIARIERNLSYAEFAQQHGRDEAYWRNRWRDKIKPTMERVRDNVLCGTC